VVDLWEPVRQHWDELTSRILAHPDRSADPVTRIKPMIRTPFTWPEFTIVLAGTRGTGKTTLHNALRRRLQVGDNVQRGMSKDEEYYSSS
jgi:hypothetical protein